jgi:hypothetical protein
MKHLLLLCMYLRTGYPYILGLLAPEDQVNDLMVGLSTPPADTRGPHAMVT